MDMVEEMEVMAEGAVEVTVTMEAVEATEVADTKKYQVHRAANSCIMQYRTASRSSEKLHSIYYGGNWLISAAAGRMFSESSPPNTSPKRPENNVNFPTVLIFISGCR